jgi:hypothetical protein
MTLYNPSYDPFWGDIMEFATFSDYLLYGSLWLIPLTKMIKFILHMRSHPKTSSGRLVSLHEEKSRLDEKVIQEKVFLHESVKHPKVKIIELHNPQVGCALGSLRGLTKPLIVIAPGLDEVSQPLFFWIYKRATFLLFSEATLVSQVLSVLFSIAVVGIFGWMYQFSFFGAFLLALWVSKGLDHCTQWVLDNKADTYATARSSLEELKEARIFLKAEFAVSNKTLHPYSISGWYKKKVLLARIARIEQAIGKENLIDNHEKFSLLESFLEKNYEAEQKFIEEKKMRVLRWIDADED